MSIFKLLQDERRWVSWRNERRGDKLTKVPYCGTDRKAKADDPTTWLSRSEAERLAPRIVNGLGGAIGYELGDLGNDLFIGGIDMVPASVVAKQPIGLRLSLPRCRHTASGRHPGRV